MSPAYLAVIFLTAYSHATNYTQHNVLLLIDAAVPSNETTNFEKMKSRLSDNILPELLQQSPSSRYAVESYGLDAVFSRNLSSVDSLEDLKTVVASVSAQTNAEKTDIYHGLNSEQFDYGFKYSKQRINNAGDRFIIVLHQDSRLSDVSEYAETFNTLKHQEAMVILLYLGAYEIEEDEPIYMNISQWKGYFSYLVEYTCHFQNLTTSLPNNETSQQCQNKPSTHLPSLYEIFVQVINETSSPATPLPTSSLSSTAGITLPNATTSTETITINSSAITHNSSTSLTTASMNSSTLNSTVAPSTNSYSQSNSPLTTSRITSSATISSAPTSKQSRTNQFSTSSTSLPSSSKTTPTTLSTSTSSSTTSSSTTTSSKTSSSTTSSSTTSSSTPSSPIPTSSSSKLKTDSSTSKATRQGSTSTKTNSPSPILTTESSSNPHANSTLTFSTSTAMNASFKPTRSPSTHSTPLISTVPLRSSSASATLTSTSTTTTSPSTASTKPSRSSGVGPWIAVISAVFFVSCLFCVWVGRRGGFRCSPTVSAGTMTTRDLVYDVPREVIYDVPPCACAEQDSLPTTSAPNTPPPPPPLMQRLSRLLMPAYWNGRASTESPDVELAASRGSSGYGVLLRDSSHPV